FFFYWNNQYRDAYTNNGNLLGSSVGRDARAYETSSTYWWSAQNKLTLSYKQIKTGNMFLPGGGTQTDIALSGQWQPRQDVMVSPLVQFERYLIPSLGGPKKDVSIGLQITFNPKNLAVSR